jgi:hypothetical protein
MVHPGGTGGTGNTPPVSPPQGNNGGAGNPNLDYGGWRWWSNCRRW